VHHPDYVEGLKPWEYPIEFCVVLCRKCHAVEHGIIPPPDGWVILHSDLEDNTPSDSVECGRCNADIRWHVTVYHPDWGEMIVGSECAEALSLGEEIRRLKSFNRRLRNFINSPRWRKTKVGLKITSGGHEISVLGKEGRYFLNIDNVRGRLIFKDLESAKKRAFTYIESLSLNNKFSLIE
jgi:hypothetical protein